MIRFSYTSVYSFPLFALFFLEGRLIFFLGGGFRVGEHEGWRYSVYSANYVVFILAYLYLYKSEIFRPVSTSFSMHT